MNRPRILLADEHWLMMQGIRSLLHYRADVVGMYENGEDLVNLGARIRPDIVILEVSLPLINGLEAGRRLREAAPDVKLIYVTQQTGVDYLNEAMEFGIVGYLLKRSAYSELESALDAVWNGQTYITPLMKHLNPVFRDGDGGDHKLTSRELEVLRLAANGRRAKEVADELRISVKTVQFHRANLTQKLGIRTTAGLVKYALRRGFVAP